MPHKINKVELMQNKGKNLLKQVQLCNNVSLVLSPSPPTSDTNPNKIRRWEV
jgi:hypothetical protein